MSPDSRKSSPGVVLDGQAFSQSPAAITASTKLARDDERATGKVDCYIFDEDPLIRHFLSVILHGQGLRTQEFDNKQVCLRALARTPAELIFLDVGVDTEDAIEILNALATRGYFGFVQLMSSRGSAVLQHMQAIGARLNLTMLSGLKKPFQADAVNGIISTLKLGHGPAVATCFGLDEALKNDWLEFWFQPKIDLRHKQLAGAEVLVRAHHPQAGVVGPQAFIPGASDGDLSTLAESALMTALEASAKLSELGINLSLTINMSIKALSKIPIAAIVRENRSKSDQWPGLLIDVEEEEIVLELALAQSIADSLAHLNVRLAIDNFGRELAFFREQQALPFAEYKLARSFVANCATDKSISPICRSVIKLAHTLNAATVAVGIENGSDAMALVSMGCEYGQGLLLGRPMAQDQFFALLKLRAKKPARLATQLTSSAAVDPGGAVAAS
jgi:EAL domain-containing protein (putative c-di-GMP-specific phosphodiesterase class I)